MDGDQERVIMEQPAQNTSMTEPALCKIFHGVHHSPSDPLIQAEDRMFLIWTTAENLSNGVYDGSSHISYLPAIQERVQGWI